QAKVQVEVMQDGIKGYDAASRQELATRGDIQDVRAEIQSAKHEILKWAIGVAIGQATLIIDAPSNIIKVDYGFRDQTLPAILT
ncbi:MAG: CCDC90 family protein, partial [Desulfovibrio sp.]|nr:CCDC90 family protein [Desulfovibrio sp.]